MTKSELREKIKCLKHNIQVHKEVAERQYQVALKMYDLLVACGYTREELNKYLTGNKFNSNYLLEPKSKVALSMIDCQNYDLGNYFKTKEEAEEKAKQIRDVFKGE